MNNTNQEIAEPNKNKWLNVLISNILATMTNLISNVPMRSTKRRDQFPSKLLDKQLHKKAYPGNRERVNSIITFLIKV